MGMTSSEQLSASLYDQLGAEGLAARTNPAWDTQILHSLGKLLSPAQDILDAGCGYGRITIPLALAGHHMTGLDLSETLLNDARDRADRQHAPIQWVQDSMCRMPVGDRSFDIVLCLWSAFHELLEEEEQLMAIREFHRVLRPGGWCLIEGGTYRQATDEEIASGQRSGPEGRVSLDIVAGQPNPHFCHDLESYGRLMERAGIPTFHVYEAEWAGRPRQFLRFERSVTDADPSVATWPGFAKQE
jgi:SAM-dependent methyltransferase